jgi:hypothetical protein
MAARDRLRRAVRSELKQAGVARLDFVAQRRSLAIGGGGVACRWRATHFLARLDLDIGEPCAAQFLADQCDIVIAVRRPSEESRRVVRKHCGDGVGDVVGKGVLFDAIPDTETKRPPGLSTRRASA